MKRSAVSRLLPWLLVGLISIGSGLGFFTLWKGQGETRQRMEMELVQRRQESETFQAQVQAVTEKLGTVQSERADLEKKSVQLKSQLETVNTEVERTKTELAQAQDRYDRLSAKHAELESELTYLRAERDAAKQAAEHARTAQDDLERTVVRLRGRMELLDRDYKKLAGSLESLNQSTRPGLNVLADSTWGPLQTPAVLADSSSVTAGAAAPTQPAAVAAAGSIEPAVVELSSVRVTREQDDLRSAVSGQVVEVNAPHRFVIVNKGSDDGVEAGMVFNVLHDTVPVGQVRASRVRPGLTACDVVTAAAVQVGDVALQRSQ